MRLWLASNSSHQADGQSGPLQKHFSEMIAWKRMHGVPIRSRAPTGFTLVELIVVIAVVLILASLLLPVLSDGKSKAKAIICLNHHRQLILATMLYAGDHEDSFPANLGAAETRRSVSAGSFLNWVNNVMSWELDSDNTNLTWIRAGGIGPYLPGDVSVFKCPEDAALSDLQEDAGWSGRVRSVSMNAMVGDAGEFTRTGVNTNNPYYKQFFKLGQVPEPSRIFVYTEEHPDSINDGYFLNKPYSGEWHDLPASYHQGAAHLAFADGHVERRLWTQSSTKPPARPDAAQLPFSISENDLDDFVWLMERTSVKRYDRYSSAHP